MVPPNLVSQLRTISHSVARACRCHYSNGGSKPHNSFTSAAQVEEASCILRTVVQALDLRHDKAMHAKLVKQALLSSLYLRNNLLNMYAKCGHLPDALQLFDEMTHKNVVSWTAVIAGSVQKGHPVEALSLFRRMHMSGTKPNEFSFVSALHACSSTENHAHAYQTYALILRFGFQSNIYLMKPKSISSTTDVYGMHPRENHYACMVNLLGRQGRTKEAEELILEMSFQPGLPVWQTLLGVCELHSESPFPSFPSKFQENIV